MKLLHFAERTRYQLLPAPGGYYEQDPKLLEQWSILWRMKDQFEARKQEKEANDARNRPKSR